MSSSPIAAVMLATREVGGDGPWQPEVAEPAAVPPDPRCGTAAPGLPGAAAVHDRNRESVSRP